MLGLRPFHASFDSFAGRMSTFDQLLSQSNPSSPLVIAHRGFSGLYPENTLVAFEKASDLGVDMIELDVTLTRDGKVIVLHDETLDRTTSGTGPAMALDLDEIEKLDCELLVLSRL